MAADKSKSAWLYPGDKKREAEFRAAGAQHFIQIDGVNETWRDAVKLVRPGEGVQG